MAKGLEIIRYENSFSKLVGTDSAFSFWKGRVALYAILKAVGLGPGDEVILPGFTCVVVPNAVSFTGAKPIFADIAPGTYNLNPACVEKTITSRTRAIIIQHTFGVPADLDSLIEIGRRRRIPIIEDCAHALGSTYRGQRVGTFGAAAFFSSQWSKPYTTGLGGVAVTSDLEIAKRLQKVQTDFIQPPLGPVVRLRAQYALYQRFFRPRLYWLAVDTLRRMTDWNLFVGSSGTEELNNKMPADTSWRMSSFQARMGVKRLKTLQQNLGHRRELATFYEERLEAEGWPLAPASGQTECVYLRYPLHVANKWELLESAEKARIELGSWFESVLHPIRTSLERFGYELGQCPVGEKAASEIVNLPLHPRVSIAEAERIVEFVARRGIPLDSRD